jgi:cytochrome b561
MLLLLVAVYASIELREFYPKGSAMRAGLKNWHFSLGLAVFFLVWIRIVIVLFNQKPAIEPPPPEWQAGMAVVVKVALYLFMIVMPLLGWVTLSASGNPVMFFDWQMPSLVAANKQFAKQVEEVHEAIGSFGYVLIGLHAAAALVHHYVMRDNTLRRMLP